MKHGKKLLGLVFFGLIISGVGLYWSLPASPDDFPHPLNGAFRQWHGLFTFLSLLCIGQVWADHLRKQLKNWRRHLDGVMHLALWLSLIITGYLLYFPSDTLTAWLNIGQLHWYLALALVVMLPLHILLHRHKKPARKQKTALATRVI